MFRSSRKQQDEHPRFLPTNNYASYIMNENQKVIRVYEKVDEEKPAQQEGELRVIKRSVGDRKTRVKMVNL